MTTIRLQVAPRVAPDNPRGARVAAAVFLALWRLGGGLWRTAMRPTPRADEDARRVRELAQQQDDPRVAAELLAAADHHELLHAPR